MITIIDRKQAELEVLQKAAQALQDADNLQQAINASNERLRALCRSYDSASGTRAFQPHHLRQECQARGLL
jgi:hypothetical protein